MSAFIKPIIHAFLICDTIIIDSLTGKKSIIGAFTHLWAKAFPCHHPQIGVYFSLTDAEGLYNFEIQLLYLDKNLLVGKGPLPAIQIHDRLATHDFGLNIPYLLFPGPGRYEFRLYAEGHFITQKDFQVIQQQHPPAASPPHPDPS
jgi:hypothetical protein